MNIQFRYKEFVKCCKNLHR